MATPFVIPRVFPGATIAVAACGPSLTRTQLDRCRGKADALIVVSDAFRLAPWANLLHSCDAGWWHHANNRDALNFAGAKTTLDDSTVFPDVLLIGTGETEGFEADPAKVATGGNSGYQAVHIAAHLGAACIVLLGFDMGFTPGGATHFFGDHPGDLQRKSPFPFFLKNFDTLAPELARRGVSVINCSPASRLECFPRAPLSEVFS